MLRTSDTHMIRKAGFVSHKSLNIHKSFIFTNTYDYFGLQIQDSDQYISCD